MKIYYTEVKYNTKDRFWEKIVFYSEWLLYKDVIIERSNCFVPIQCLAMSYKIWFYPFPSFFLCFFPFFFALLFFTLFFPIYFLPPFAPIKTKWFRKPWIYMGKNGRFIKVKKLSMHDKRLKIHIFRFTFIS